MASIEVMGSLPAFALDCTLENVGRTIASTKVRIRWHFVFNGQTDDHLVALVHSSLSGKKQVFLDGQMVHEENEAVFGEWRHMLQVDRRNVEIVIGTVTSENAYDLVVEGCSFDTLPRSNIDRLREQRRRKEAAALQAAAEGKAGAEGDAATMTFEEIVASTPSPSKSGKRHARRPRGGTAGSLAATSPPDDSAAFDPFASPTQAEPAGGPPVDAFDPFAAPAPAPAPVPAPAPAPAPAEATDPFAWGAGGGGVGSFEDDGLGGLNFDASAPRAQTASTSVGVEPATDAVFAAGGGGHTRGLVDLDNLGAPRVRGGSKPRKVTASLGELARVSAARPSGQPSHVMDGGGGNFTAASHAPTPAPAPAPAPTASGQYDPFAEFG